MLPEIPENCYPSWKPSVPLFEMDADFNPHRYSGDLIETWKIKYGSYIPEFLEYLDSHSGFDIFVNWNAYNDRNPSDWGQKLLVVNTSGVSFESDVIDWGNFDRKWRMQELQMLVAIASNFIDSYEARENRSTATSSTASWYIRDSFKNEPNPQGFSTSYLRIYVEEKKHKNQGIVGRALSRIRGQFF